MSAEAAAHSLLAIYHDMILCLRSTGCMSAHHWIQYVNLTLDPLHIMYHCVYARSPETIRASRRCHPWLGNSSPHLLAPCHMGSLSRLSCQVCMREPCQQYQKLQDPGRSCRHILPFLRFVGCKSGSAASSTSHESHWGRQRLSHQHFHIPPLPPPPPPSWGGFPHAVQIDPVCKPADSFRSFIC